MCRQQHSAPEYHALPRYLGIVSVFRESPSSHSFVEFEIAAETWRTDAVREMLLAISRRDVRALQMVQAAVLLHLEVFLRGAGSRAARDFHLGAALQLMAAADTALSRDFKRTCHLLVLWSFQGTLDVEALVPRLQAAVDRFGSDPDLLLVQGTLFELLASRPDRELESVRVPAVMVVAELTDRTGGTQDPVSIRVQRPAVYTYCARLYRRALALSPNLHEARVRLARVLMEGGRPFEALQVLNDLPAAGELAQPRLRYLASLVRARVLLRLGRSEEAADACRQAGRLFPGCQTPLVALSASLRASGALDASRDVMRGALTGGSCAEDPWASYPAGQAWRVIPSTEQLERGLRR